jgi:hypothetical protein
MLNNAALLTPAFLNNAKPKLHLPVQKLLNCQYERHKDRIMFVRYRIQSILDPVGYPGIQMDTWARFKQGPTDPPWRHTPAFSLQHIFQAHRLERSQYPFLSAQQWRRRHN